MDNWDILDKDRVEDLRSGSISDVVASLSGGDGVTPEARAEMLAKLAIDGQLPRLRLETGDMRQWASEHGLRRLENALIELDRVTRLEARGQAILQSQALTRFIRLHVTEDVQTLSKAITNA